MLQNALHTKVTHALLRGRFGMSLVLLADDYHRAVDNVPKIACCRQTAGFAGHLQRTSVRPRGSRRCQFAARGSERRLPPFSPMTPVEVWFLNPGTHGYETDRHSERDPTRTSQAYQGRMCCAMANYRRLCTGYGSLCGVGQRAWDDLMLRSDLTQCSWGPSQSRPYLRAQCHAGYLNNLQQQRHNSPGPLGCRLITVHMAVTGRPAVLECVISVMPRVHT